MSGTAEAVEGAEALIAAAGASGARTTAVAAPALHEPADLVRCSIVAGSAWAGRLSFAEFAEMELSAGGSFAAISDVTVERVGSCSGDIGSGLRADSCPACR